MSESRSTDFMQLSVLLKVVSVTYMVRWGRLRSEYTVRTVIHCLRSYDTTGQVDRMTGLGRDYSSLHR